MSQSFTTTVIKLSNPGLFNVLQRRIDFLASQAIGKLTDEWPSDKLSECFGGNHDTENERRSTHLPEEKWQNR